MHLKSLQIDMSHSPRCRIIKSPVLLLLLLSLFLLASCGGKQQSITEQQATIDLALLETLPSDDISYNKLVQPVLERRCVVCHGCYDAPCQLKLSSPAGVERGANIESVYNGARFKTMSPTRLYSDAKSTKEWRQKGFHSIINEGEDTPETNLEQSVMYQMLRLKQMNPQARVGMLPDSVDLSLARSESCPTVEPLTNMPGSFQPRVCRLPCLTSTMKNTVSWYSGWRRAHRYPKRKNHLPVL